MAFNCNGIPLAASQLLEAESELSDVNITCSNKTVIMLAI